MPKKLKLKSKKSLKIKNKDEKTQVIPKRELSPEERENKLRRDRIKIARRYEEMRLYDEAIKYYKKVGLLDDVKRVSKIKKDIYVNKAREFETNGKYEDAARLYENLKMDDDLARVKKLMGDDEYLDETEDEEDTATEDELDEELESGWDEDEIEDEDVTGDQGLVGETEISDADSGIQITKISTAPASESGKKIFKICPYCGEELNLPKKPNFCPYCMESFV